MTAKTTGIANTVSTRSIGTIVSISRPPKPNTNHGVRVSESRQHDGIKMSHVWPACHLPWGIGVARLSAGPRHGSGVTAAHKNGQFLPFDPASHLWWSA